MADAEVADLRCADPTHRSYTSDGWWDKCQFLWHARTHLGVPDPMGDKGVVGHVVDRAIQRIVHGTPATPEQVRGMLEEEIAASQRDAARGGVPVPFFDLDKMTPKALALIDLWDREVRPTWGKVYATQMIVHWTNPVDGETWHAHLDDVFTDGAITDIKTSEARLGKDRQHTDYQLTTYAAGIWFAFGHLAPWVGLDGLIYANPPADVTAWNPQAKKPWWDRARSKRTVRQIEAWAQDAARRTAAMRFAEATDTYQTQGRGSPYACSGCPAKRICPAWAGTDGGPA